MATNGTRWRSMRDANQVARQSLMRFLSSVREVKRKRTAFLMAPIVGMALLITLITASISTTNSERIVWSSASTESGLVKTALVRAVPLGITVDFIPQAEAKIGLGLVLLRGPDWFLLDDGSSLSGMRVGPTGTPQEEIFSLRIPSRVRAMNEMASLHIDNVQRLVSLDFSDGLQVSSDSAAMFSLVEFERPDSSRDEVATISALTEQVDRRKNRLREVLWWIAAGFWVSAIGISFALTSRESNSADVRPETSFRSE